MNCVFNSMHLNETSKDLVFVPFTQYAGK